MNVQVPFRYLANHYFQGVRLSEGQHRFLQIFRCGSIRKRVAAMKEFPTIEEVQRAGKEQLARWYRFLPSGETPADQEIMKRIAQRFEKLGGMTPELRERLTFLDRRDLIGTQSDVLPKKCL